MRNRDVTSVLLVLIGFSVSLPAACMTLEELKQFSQVAREAQEQTCAAVEQKGNLTEAEADATAKAGLDNLLKKFVNLNVDVHGKIQEKSYRGVAQRDLAESLKNVADCRRYVLEKYMNLLTPSNTPITPKPAPDVPVKPIQTSDAPLKAAITYKRTGPILRVFLKRNMTATDLPILAAALPNYRVMLGHSSMDTRLPADVLFVNRDKIRPDEVVTVISTLASMGVKIKTVQQEPLGNKREIQIGTIGGDSHQISAVSDLPALNATDLSQLRGTEFWRAAVNGRPFCPLPDHYSTPECALDDQARFVMTE